jgi:hypothetical protein
LFYYEKSRGTDLDKRKLKSFTKYAIIFFFAVVITSLVWNLNQLLLFKDLSYSEDYDYIVYMDATKMIIVKNGTTGRIDFTGWNFSQLIHYLLRNDGLKIFLKGGEYNASTDVILQNFKGVKIMGDGASRTKLNLNGHSIIIHGEHWEDSQNNHIEGITLENGSIIIENSFMTTIKNCVFVDSNDGIILFNTNSWTECTLIENCYFIGVKRGIVFRTAIGNGTRSYASTEIRRVYFELRREGAIGIYVEHEADFNEGLIYNVRFWMGKPAEKNQTGMLIEGSMLNTVLQAIIFESFALSPQNIYGMVLGKDSDPPIIGQGIVFLGNLTCGINNPYCKWIYGAGGSFKMENIPISLGLNNVYGASQEIGQVPHLSLAISSLNLKINVEGNLSADETVYVRLRLKFIDGSLSKQLEIAFEETETKWLSYDDWLSIWPARTIISSIVVDAKTTSYASNAKVTVSVYGQYS